MPPYTHALTLFFPGDAIPVRQTLHHSLEAATFVASLYHNAAKAVIAELPVSDKGGDR